MNLTFNFLTPDMVTTTRMQTSNEIPIIVGVTGGVGGLLIGGLAVALFFILTRRSPRQAQEYTGLRLSEQLGLNADTSNTTAIPLDNSDDPAPQDPNESIEEASAASSLRSVYEDSPTTTTAEWRGRWNGGTRYEQVSSNDAGQPALRRVATMDFQSGRR